MPKYKQTNPSQGQFLPVFFPKQLQKSTLEFAIDFIIDHELNLSHLDQRYVNDENGAPAYNPRILLKIILVAYSRGIKQSVVKKMLYSWHFQQTADHTSRPFLTFFHKWIRRLSFSFERFFFIAMNSDLSAVKCLPSMV